VPWYPKPVTMSNGTPGSLQNLPVMARLTRLQNAGRWICGKLLGGFACDENGNASQERLEGLVSDLGMLPGIGVPFNLPTGVLAAKKGNWGGATLAGVAAVPDLGAGAKLGTVAEESGETVSLFKASQRGLGAKHLQEGYKAADFPGKGALFSRQKEVAGIYATHYGEGIIETRIPADHTTLDSSGDSNARVFPPFPK
jgi:hypothetical protein